MAISESQSTRVSMVESGQANITVEPPISEQERLTKEGLFKMSPYLGSYYYSFNTQKAPFDNPLVRKAFSMAVDREKLVNNVIKGGKEPAYAWVPPGLTNPVTKQDFRREGGNPRRIQSHKKQKNCSVKPDIQMAKVFLL